MLFNWYFDVIIIVSVGMFVFIMCYGEKVNIEGFVKLLRKFRIEFWKFWKFCLEVKKEKGFEKELSKME